jgi:hypothetical protein
MKKWIRKWLGITTKDSEAIIELWKAVFKLQDDVKQIYCYKSWEEVPKDTALYATIDRLIAIIDYLDIEFYMEQKLDDRYVQQPKYIEIRKARKKFGSEK